MVNKRPKYFSNYTRAPHEIPGETNRLCAMFFKRNLIVQKYYNPALSFFKLLKRMFSMKSLRSLLKYSDKYIDGISLTNVNRIYVIIQAYLVNIND